MEPAKYSEEMRTLQLHHAHQICGIVAHSQDHGIALVALRSLAIGAAALIERREQEEALKILIDVNKQRGRGLGSLESELKRAWGWERPVLPSPFWNCLNTQGHRTPGSILPPLTMAVTSDAPIALRTVRVPEPRTFAASPTRTSDNPLRFADFRLPNRPYRNFYEPPNRTDSYTQEIKGR